MKVRFAQEKDKSEIVTIWNYCFQDSEDFVDYYFEEVYRPENTMVVDDSGKIISALQLNQYKINVRGIDFPVSYIVGVSTLPEFRGKGMMKKVMEQMLAELVSRGQELSILMPIDTRLYRRFGFENSYDLHQNRVAVDRLVGFKLEGNFFRVNNKLDKKAKGSNKLLSSLLSSFEGREKDIVDENMLDDLVKIYSEATKNLNAYVIRDKKYYRRFLKEINAENAYVYINYIEGEPIAYIAYDINGEEINVRDLYYINTRGLRSCLAFIYSHNTQAKVAIISQPVNSKLRYLIPNHTWLSTQLKQFMMARINILDKAMEVYINKLNKEDGFKNYSELEGVNLILKIYDPYIEKNNAYLKLELTNGVISYSLTNEENEFDRYFDLTINDLTSIYFAYKSVYDIEALEDLDDKQKLLVDIIFPKKDNHINEYI